ncbi:MULTISPECIES: sn-glycerol-3-phosphate ABC transporter ATP-binding protein UgpC [Rhizobium/Agrobacterium group]|uniref:ABC transporter ATP-binding protein n=1 Tax=Rhizobium/Agrobacterium group TaxID=227290 RepID=UPI001ADD05F2|nr:MULTISPECIES: sn-glycerol-3-phosphate ABC transporter ATP-binding protein UgpC [Rhizobium/Agrobacterium group]MBO9112620.1 sn-glycerol-3-phosphate ABC transporter ATP-binding protein UgpC [Agrobacterium sp. S2/73]QXZ76121.1 sn-glycerol-3-phosphate ABC transporter ATP-binding protein UgpC [Agrobacterium sp. S7/73]QYA16875.1 sn-glycerol-3-phosphate ABC transporter ATP-binding protein UgpC [Rhizobium sp. AB2/73]UEQ85553.1 sn-glycerol-3-phosphate ABC transporter ATP-binding protein UgpC [Rhizobi
MARLELKSLQKNYGSLSVIKDVSLSIDDGEFVVFVGPSGCGKSTLLRMVAGLEGISGGELWIGDLLCNDIEPRDRGIAMVFQNYALYPHLSVYENMGFGLKLSKAPKDIRDRKIRDAARILQIEHLLDRKPGQLSGGQRQRVAIGRAIVRKPDVFLFDEPLSNLDAALRTDMRMELAKLHQDLAATMIYVTHDQVEAMTLADKIVVLNGGVIQQIGSPIELYKRPANLFVASFIGSPKMNLLPGQINTITESTVEVSLAGPAPFKLAIDGSRFKAGEKVTLGVRPQALVLSDNGQLSGEVMLIERLGSETNVKINLASGESILAVISGDCGIQVGQSIRCGFSLSDVIVFDGAGQAHFASVSHVLPHHNQISR